MSDLDWLDLYRNDEPVCPFCAARLRDAWELDLYRDDDSTVAECQKCDREFRVTLNISYTYTTAKLRAELEGSDE